MPEHIDLPQRPATSLAGEQERLRDKWLPRQVWRIIASCAFKAWARRAISALRKALSDPRQNRQ